MVDGQGGGGDADVEAAASLADSRAGGHGAAVPSAEALRGKSPAPGAGQKRGSCRCPPHFLPAPQTGRGKAVTMGRGRWGGPPPAWEAAGPCPSQRGLPRKGRPCTVGTCLPCLSSFTRPAGRMLSATLRSRNCNQAHFQREKQGSKEIKAFT